ncbi:hypothetical protein LSTR_LSTR002378 [Laodelphax striatellus]|uniref:Telomerase reverse transcriptase n=1 Tax=Laodelphax striatellus TaxID=195883 RepID=A0A482X284_LAOST|nr:hypothetical protein LSTR_LSTR002378 [Laodelphax striatellus]
MFVFVEELSSYQDRCLKILVHSRRLPVRVAASCPVLLGDSRMILSTFYRKLKFIAKMELIVGSHSNVKDFSEFISHLIQSHTGTDLLEKFQGILISIPEDLLIVRSEEKSQFPISWANFKEVVLCSSRSLKVNTNLKWLKSTASSLNFNLCNLLEDEKWELLYNHLGENVMSKIFMKCQLFFPLNSTSYTPLYCEKAVKNINKFNSKTQFIKNNKTEKIIFNLRSILYGKNLLSAQPSEPETLSEKDICNRIVDDILEVNSGGCNFTIEKSAMTFFKNEVVRKLVQKCFKNKTYKFILKNIYMRNDGSGSTCSSKSKVAEKKIISNRPKSCSEIRSVTLRKRRTRKNYLQEIQLRTVKKTISSHLNSIIPNEMFGKQKFKMIRNLLKVLEFGKNQCFSIHEILDDTSIRKIRWIQKFRKNEDKNNLIEKLVKWLITKWIFPLISLDFYVTEKQKSSNRIHFYKKAMFKRCVFSTLQKLKRNNIIQLIKEKQILGKNYDINKSHSLFRLIPKGESDVRYVIWDQLKNPLLEELRIFFKQLTSTTATSSGPDIKNNFHEYWSNLIAKWKDGGNYPLYFVKVDVSDAYGSVILMKLKQIVREFVKSLLQGIRKLTFRKYKCFNKQVSGLRCYYVWRFEELPPCVPNHTVLTPTPDHKEFELSQLLTVTYLQILMRDLKIGGSTYLIKRGIPHAGKLSASFCKIYYDELQKQHLSEYAGNANEVFYRAVDDFLFVTPSLERAKSFLQKMMRGFKDFGVYINVEKTLTNFGDSPCEVIPFFGYMLNTKTIEVYANYSIYSGVKIFYTMSFKNTYNPGRILLERMRNINSIKLDKLILDSKINSKSTLMLGIFRAAFLMSFRFKAIVNCLFKNYNSHYLVLCINTCANRISSRVSTLTTPAFGDRPVVSFEEAHWIVLAAFILNLPRLPQTSSYYHVVKVLKRELKTCGSNLSLQQKDFMRNVIKSHKKDNPFRGTH